jgi:superfamily I DNA/RNA helicase
MLGPLLHTLKEQGMPFHNPYRIKRGDWNPMGSAQRLLAFLRPDIDVWGNEQRMWTWDDLRLWTDPLQAKGNMTRGAKTLIEAKCMTDQFERTQAHDQPAFSTMLELFTDEAKPHVIAIDVDWWHEQLRLKEAKRLDFAVRAYKRGGGPALRQRPRIIIGTIHSVKGGEADTVLLFPDLSNAGYYEGLKIQGEPHASVIRQFYVGITRARNRLLLCRPSGPEHIEWSTV